MSHYVPNEGRTELKHICVSSEGRNKLVKVHLHSKDTLFYIPMLEDPPANIVSLLFCNKLSVTRFDVYVYVYDWSKCIREE
jgi:hypothetical protein